ncbi:MAG TPA: two-component sensor histidine kinase, partial [Rhodospirillum rubrum]|nr:two-component sensor histidine kinase [Rhodospirillum rubrum]
GAGSFQTPGGVPPLPPPPREGATGRSLSAKARAPTVLGLLAAVVLVMLTLGLGANLVFLYRDGVERGEAQVLALRDGAREQAAAAVSRIDLLLSGLTEGLALRPEVERWGDAGIHALLVRQRALLPMVRGIIVTNEAGRLTHDSEAAIPANMDLSDRDYVRALRADPQSGLYIGEPVRGRTSGRWFISMSRRFTDQQGAFKGVVTAVVDPVALGTVFSPFLPGAGGELEVLRDDGRVLLHLPDFERFMGAARGHQSFFRDVLAAAPSGSIRVAGSTEESVYRLEGGEAGLFFTWATVPGSPLLVTVSASYDGLLRSWWQVLPYHLGAIACIILVILALVLKVHRQIRHLNGLIVALSNREAALVAARRSSEEANRAKTLFLANMSHELRTPLNAIIGFSDMLANGIHGALADRQQDYARDINLSALHLLDLINDILDVAKIESGGYLLHERPCNLAAIIRAAERMLGPRVREKGLVMDTVCVDGEAWVMADERAMQQVLLNLLSNAVKFTPEGGRITVSLGLNEGGGMVLVVGDTGPGIPAEHLALVLEPFYQVGEVETRSHEGTGLGLPLAKALVEKHEGALRLDSQPGQGTRVSVTLPAARVLPPQRPPVEAKP